MNMAKGRVSKPEVGTDSANARVARVATATRKPAVAASKEVARGCVRGKSKPANCQCRAVATNGEVCGRGWRSTKWSSTRTTNERRIPLEGGLVIHHSAIHDNRCVVK